MRRPPRMSRLVTLCAALMLSTVLFAVPALAGTTSVSWDFSTGQTLQLDVPVEAGTIVLGEPAGSECTADVEVRNGTSTHPNNNLIVDLNGGTVVGFVGVDTDEGAGRGGGVQGGAGGLLVNGATGCRTRRGRN